MAKDVKATVGFPGQLETRTIEGVPENDPQIWDANSKLDVVGKSVPRVDGKAKVTGQARYTYDINLPGMLHGVIVRSPHPNAKVNGVDFSEAQRVPGIKATFNFEARTVRYVGDYVAAVAAESIEAARDAARKVKVDYEPLPFVVDEDEAMKPDSPRVFESRPNADEEDADINRRGDIEEGFAEAEVVVEATLRTPVQTHCCLETHGIVVRWDDDTHMTVWASTQGVFSVRDGMAEYFDLPHSNVRCITHHMGGGFGSKFGTDEYMRAAAEMARETKRPVKIMLDREEEQLSAGNRPSSVQQIRIGAKKDGTLTAIHMKSSGTGGIGGGAGCSRPLRSIYDCPNVLVEHQDVIINAGRARAMRAPGHPQGAYGIDSMMDILAEELEIDPLDLRMKNDPNPVRRREYEIGARKIGWNRRKKSGSQSGKKVRGLGMGSSIWGGMGGGGTQAIVEIARDGAVDVMMGTQDLGVGTRTILAQVAAEELGLQVDELRVNIGDTQYPFSGGSGGSQTAPSITPAIRMAAVDAKKRMFALAAPELGVEPDDLEAEGGQIRVKSDTAKSLSWKQVASLMDGEKITAHGQRFPNFDVYRNGTAGCQFAEVEVDTETGQVKVIKIVAVHDCGRVVNPLLARSQVNGGVIQGMSYALLENRILDKQTGVMVNPNLEQYKISGSMDIPEIEVEFLEVYNAGTNTGVVGLGEPPAIPTAGAISNAVANAIGKRVFSLPITPDKVLEALNA